MNGLEINIKIHLNSYLWLMNSTAIQMKKNKILSLILIFFSLALYSCQSASEALQGKKRSDQSDEFLVKKKSPLVMPPSYNELPQPSQNQSQNPIIII